MGAREEVPVGHENTHASKILQIKQVIFRNACYTHPFMHTITTSEKRGHEFEVECRAIYRRSWREEREWRNVIIIISK